MSVELIDEDEIEITTIYKQRRTKTEIEEEKQMLLTDKIEIEKRIAESDELLAVFPKAK